MAISGPTPTTGSHQLSLQPTPDVRTPQASALTSLLQAQGMPARQINDEQVEVDGIDSDTIGRIAAREGVVILELSYHHDDLETVFHELTHAREVLA